VDPKSKQKNKLYFCFSWQARLLVVNYQIPTLDEHKKNKKNGQLLWFFAHRKQKKKKKKEFATNGC
jgi:hypothetical protein